MTGSIPLKLDWWEEQCGEGRDGEDVMELHIMHNAGMEREADGASDAGKLTDSQLDDTIDRLIENRKRLKLADGGQKLSIYLKKHIDEKNRRRRTPRPEFISEGRSPLKAERCLNSVSCRKHKELQFTSFNF